MFDVFGLSDTPRSPPPPRDIFTLKVPCGHFGETFVKVMKLVCRGSASLSKYLAVL